MDIDQDDLPVGRVLTRREALVLLGAGGTAAILAACAPGALSSASAAATHGATSGLGTASATATAAATAIVAASSLPGCVVRPEETEGPYFVDEKLHRSDIRSDPSDGSVRTAPSSRSRSPRPSVTGNSCAPLRGRARRRLALRRRWASTRTYRTRRSTPRARSSCAATR